MFQVKDVILYGTQGVCEITGTEEKSVGGKKRTYFILKPVSDKGSTVFVPTDNELALRKMRRLLTGEEIHRLIDSLPEEGGLWIDNENERRELFKSVLSEGDPRELIRMVKAIHLHKTRREAEGKRLHMSDERFFKDAEQVLCNEFQYVLGIGDKESMLAYIFSRLEK